MDNNGENVINVGPSASALPRFKQGWVTQCNGEKFHNVTHSAQLIAHGTKKAEITL